jgi:hypothetical protein
MLALLNFDCLLKSPIKKGLEIIPLEIQNPIDIGFLYYKVI